MESRDAQRIGMTGDLRKLATLRPSHEGGRQRRRTKARVGGESWILHLRSHLAHIARLFGRQHGGRVPSANRGLYRQRRCATRSTRPMALPWGRPYKRAPRFTSRGGGTPHQPCAHCRCGGMARAAHRIGCRASQVIATRIATRSGTNKLPSSREEEGSFRSLWRTILVVSLRQPRRLRNGSATWRMCYGHRRMPVAKPAEETDTVTSSCR